MENSLVSAVWKQQQGECYINKEKDNNNNNNKEKCNNIHKEKTITRRIVTTAMERIQQHQREYDSNKEKTTTKTTII